MDERSNKLLEELVKNPNATLKTIQTNLSINRRQAMYSFDKLNAWVEQMYNTKIKRTRDGYFIIPSMLIQNSSEENNDYYILSESERVDMLVLMILNREDDFSLLHLTESLQVSKNTALKTIKQTKDILDAYHLKIQYSRLIGYHIVGKEYEKRRLGIKIIQRYAWNLKGKKMLQDYADLSTSEANNYKSKLEICETLLGYTFTDEMMNIISYSLVIWNKRICQAKFIDLKEIKDASSLIDTKEYTAIKEVFKETSKVEEGEILYLTLQLMAMNISSLSIVSSFDLPELKDAIAETIEIFEKVSAMEVPKKALLIEKMFIHMKPAYYRMKYNLIDTDSMFVDFDHQLLNLHDVMKIAAEPLKQFVKKPIPESEMAYITLLMGGWLRQNGITFETKTIAAVVCPNGLSVSSMIKVNLSSLFTNFIFLEPMSIREFYNYEGHIDVLFATQEINTDIKQFVIDPIMNEAETRRLQSMVFKDIYGVSISTINLDEIINIIENYAEIKEKQKLMTHLNHYLWAKNSNINDEATIETPNTTLTQLLSSENVRVIEKLPSWEDAIQEAARPLISQNKINQNYVNEVINQCRKNSKYIMLNNRLAIPHSKPEHGVKELGMSFLKLNEPVVFPEGHEIKLICLIAAVDKEKHIRPLLSLRKIAEKNSLIKKISELETSEEIKNIIHNFNEKEEKDVRNNHL